MCRMLAVMAMAIAGASQAEAADRTHPMVVELYQSQGCSSCPPANAVLNGLSDRPDILALSFAVTYWDYLGWKDRFAKPEFTARQWDYARTGGRRNVATPQMVINGRAVLVGHNKAAVEAAITRNDRGTAGPGITIADNRVTVGSGAHNGTATVWLARYDPRTIQVPIAAGENGGRTLPHRNIVRTLVKLGEWNGTATSFTLPARVAGLRDALLVQAGKGGSIIAARGI